MKILAVVGLSWKHSANDEQNSPNPLGNFRKPWTSSSNMFPSFGTFQFSIAPSIFLGNKQSLRGGIFPREKAVWDHWSQKTIFVFQTTNSLPLSLQTRDDTGKKNTFPGKKILEKKYAPGPVVLWSSGPVVLLPSGPVALWSSTVWWDYSTIVSFPHTLMLSYFHTGFKVGVTSVCALV